MHRLRELCQQEALTCFDFFCQWEKDQIFPAHELFKKFGDAGLLGINKPVEYGGLGLDYKYQMAFLEASGHIRASGVAMGIGVQTDCATPALARFGSDQLKRDFLAPAIAGDHVACIGVSEPGTLLSFMSPSVTGL